MKSKIAMISVIAVMMASLSFSAMADNQPAPVAQSVQPQGAQQPHQDRFEKKKQKLVQHLQFKASKIQECLDCVQKAQDSKTLHACLHAHKHSMHDQKDK